MSQYYSTSKIYAQLHIVYLLNGRPIEPYLNILTVFDLPCWLLMLASVLAATVALAAVLVVINGFEREDNNWAGVSTFSIVAVPYKSVTRQGNRVMSRFSSARH